jgi:hypothetical protein
MDSKLYPQGKTAHYSKYVANVLKFFRRSDQSEFFSIDGVAAQLYVPNTARTVRVRATAAEVNAGTKQVVAAVAGYQHRIVDCTMIAIGGAAATATSVDILTTQSAAVVRPVVNAVAALTQSARVSMGEAPAAGTSAVLADGASFALNDANTAILVSKQTGGGSLGTATHVDVILTYVTERV